MPSHLIPRNVNNSYIAYKMSLCKPQNGFLNVKNDDVIPHVSVPVQPTMSVECKHWNMGTCRFGDKCKNIHTPKLEEANSEVKVSNVPISLDKAQIEKVAMRFGELLYYRDGNPQITMRGPSNGYVYGMALVYFAKIQSALDFINYINDTPFDGVVLYACINNKFRPSSSKPPPVFASSNDVSNAVIRKKVAPVVIDEDGFQLPKRKGRFTAIDATPMKSDKSQRDADDSKLVSESETLIKKILDVSNDKDAHQEEQLNNVAKPIETTESPKYVTIGTWHTKSALDDNNTLQKKKITNMIDFVDTTETRRAIDRCWYTKEEFRDYYGRDHKAYWESAVRNTPVSAMKSWAAALCPNIDELPIKKLENQYSVAGGEHTKMMKIDFESDAACKPCDEPMKSYDGFVQEFEETYDETDYEDDEMFAVVYSTTHRM